MKIWKIWGNNLQVLEIVADSFDDALNEARKVNKDYNTVQLKEKR